MRFGGGGFRLLSGICFGLIWLFVYLRADGCIGYAVSRLAFGNSWVCGSGEFLMVGVVGKSGLCVFWLVCVGLRR